MNDTNAGIFVFYGHAETHPFFEDLNIDFD